MCSEHTNIFYCITCFLPILTGYGFSNILLPEEILPETEKNETEMLEPENAETEDLETKNLETATTVSYTHLDVYKRQAWKRARSFVNEIRWSEYYFDL